MRTDGSIISWGRNNLGQVSHTPTGTGFTQVTGGKDHSLALGPNGSIVAWGDDLYSQVSDAPSGTGFTHLAAGKGHSLAMKAEGSIFSWGINWGTPPSEAGFVQIAAGDSHSLALHSDGSIVSWGNDSGGVVSNTPTGTDFTQIAAGFSHLLALRSDGTIVAWGLDSFGEVSDAPNGSGFSQLGSGWGHCLALKDTFSDNSGSAFCLGDGSGSPCPCSNGASGQGCASTSGFGGATLMGSGHGALGTDTLQLNVHGVPGGKPGLILRGAQQVNGGLGNPVGDGLLCVGGQASRSQVQNTSLGLTSFANFNGLPFGASSYGVGIPTNYQFWYRDTANTCSGTGFNFSNGWTVIWQL